MERFPRITLNPDVMGGKACIRGLRVTVATAVGLLASGRSADEILAAYPYLVAYTAWRLEEREVTLTVRSGEGRGRGYGNRCVNGSGGGLLVLAPSDR